MVILLLTMPGFVGAARILHGVLTGAPPPCFGTGWDADVCFPAHDSAAGGMVFAGALFAACCCIAVMGWRLLTSSATRPR